MKKMKRIFGIATALTLIFQSIVMPHAEEETASPTAYGRIVTATATENNKWTAYNNKAEVTAAEDGSCVTMTQTEIGSQAMMLYKLNEDEQIQFSDGNTVIIETVINPDIEVTSSYGPYVHVRFNVPESDYEAVNYYMKDGTTKYEIANYKQQVLGGFSKGYPYGICGTYGKLSNENYPCDGSKEYKMVMYLKDNCSYAKTDIFDEEGNLLHTNEKAFTAANISDLGYLRNVAVTEVNAGNGMLKTDVKYLHVYNLPNEYVDEYEKHADIFYATDLTISELKVGGTQISDGALDVKTGDISFSAIGMGDISATLSYENQYTGESGNVDCILVKDGDGYNIEGAVTETDSVYTFTVSDSMKRITYTFTTVDGEKASRYGLITKTEGDSAEDFTLYNDFAEMSASEEGYVRLAQKEIGTKYDVSAMTYDFSDDKIKMSEKNVIVVDMKIRAGATDFQDVYGPYASVRYNMPKNPEEASSLVLADGSAYSSALYHLALAGFSDLYGYEVNGKYFSDSAMKMKDTMSEWRRVVIKICDDTAWMAVYKENGEMVYAGEKTKIKYASKLKYLENIGFSELNANNGKLTTDVDYIRVYNMPEGYENDFENYTGIVDKEDIIGEEINGVYVKTFDTALTDEDIKNITVTNRDNKDMTFFTSVSDDGKTVTIRVHDPIEADRYLVSIKNKKYNCYVGTPYKALLSEQKFETDIPEIFENEGVALYAASYDETGRMVSVQKKKVTEEITECNITGKNEIKTFLWDENNTPVMTLEDKTYTIGFIGGSLTEQGYVWRNKVKEIIGANMPDKEIITYAAGKGGTNSTYGAARFGDDIAQYNPDLVFIEFAVNDYGNNEKGHTTYMESMIRQCLQLKKVPDIIFLYATEPCEKESEEYNIWREGVDYKEKLAAHYGIKTINVYDYVYNEYETEVDKTEYPTFSDYLASLGYVMKDNGYFDVHAGFGKYAEAIEEQFTLDYDGCFTRPKNVDIYMQDDIINVKGRYNQIYMDSDRLTFEGDWNIATKSNPGESANYHYSYPYFDKGIAENTTGSAKVTFKTDAAQVAMCYPSSNKGNSAKLYIDGELQNKNVGCYGIYNNIITTTWIRLPNDGAEHTVTIEADVPVDENNLIRVGSFIEYYIN